jgi:hypothetical protein
MAAVLTAFGLVLGLVGSGVGASFIWNGSAVQPINIGTLQLQVSSTTEGAVVSGNTVTCPAIFVDVSVGPTDAGEAIPTCNITVASVGSIPARNLSVFMSATTNGAHLDRFAVRPTGLILTGPATVPLSTTSVPLGVATSFPASINMALVWGDDFGGTYLENSDMGKTITVTFALSSNQ